MKKQIINNDQHQCQKPSSTVGILLLRFARFSFVILGLASWVLAYRMFPSSIRPYLYVFGSALVVIPLIVFSIEIDTTKQAIIHLACILSVFLLIASFNLVYESKKDMVFSSPPKEGPMEVILSTDESIHMNVPYGVAGFATSHSTNVTIDGTTYKSGDKVYIIPDAIHIMAIESSFTHSYSKTYSGSITNLELSLSAKDLTEPYKKTVKVNYSLGWIDVELRFRRVIDFWDVVFY